MAYVKLDIPAGVVNHGTDSEASGRWRDTNLVRWENGSLRPVGGWQHKTQNSLLGQIIILLTENVNDPEKIRAMTAWKSNNGTSHLAAGSHKELYHVLEDGTDTNITPVGFSTLGTADSAANLGYGKYYYGRGLYGVQRPNDGTLEEASSWSLDTWGEYLVGCHNVDGKIYEWTLNTSNPAAQISNAPVNNKAIVVTEERFLFALGAGGNLKKVAWCDREDNTTWTAAATNEAGDIELHTTGEIQLGIRVRGRTLILTTVDAHAATYSGPPAVFGFERVGQECGAISRHCAVAIDEGAFWMGANGFFQYNGSAVQELPCDVHDYVFKDMNTAQRSKVYAVHNGKHNEVWWFYPSADDVENDSYVALDYKEGHWMIGKLSRTAGVDAGVFTDPIYSNAVGHLYEHEKNYAYTENTGITYTPYAETGPISIGDGDQIMKVTQVIPDEKNKGDISVTFKTRFYPNDEEYTFGPYTTNSPTDVRFQGRQVRMRINGVQLTDWKVGDMRINATAGGRR